MSRLDRGSAGYVARELLGKTAFVVCIDLRVKSSPRHGHIRQPAIDELFSCLVRVHVNKHAVGGLTLAAVTRHCVAVVEMGIFFDVECDGPA